MRARPMQRRTELHTYAPRSLQSFRRRAASPAPAAEAFLQNVFRQLPRLLPSSSEKKKVSQRFIGCLRIRACSHTSRVHAFSVALPLFQHFSQPFRQLEIFTPTRFSALLFSFPPRNAADMQAVARRESLRER